MAQLVVVITGANRGIGLYMAQALLEAGHAVAAVDLNGDNLSPLLERYPDRLRYVACDVSDASCVQAAVNSIVEDWKRIDVLVNNAALALFCPFEDKDLEATRREFEVNYFGYINMIRAVLPYMKARGKGLVHNVSSGVGITGFPGLCGYASTKAAIEALTRTLAIEFKPYGIMVNLMHPPLTNTESAAPLGVPKQMMADPAIVGRKLASKIESTKPVITPDLQTALGLVVSRLTPTRMGIMLARLTERARSTRQS